MTRSRAPRYAAPVAATAVAVAVAIAAAVVAAVPARRSPGLGVTSG